MIWDLSSFLHFFELLGTNFFLAGLGWPSGQIMTVWLEKRSQYLLHYAAGHDIR